MPACTEPIRMFVYLFFLTVTLLTISVAGFTATSPLSRASTRVWPSTWPPNSVAKAVPTGR